jgi:hypothetical protein
VVLSSISGQPAAGSGPNEQCSTVATYNGSGFDNGASYETPVFTVSGNWRLPWSCAKDAVHGSWASGSYLRVDVRDENGASIDQYAIDRPCTSSTWLSGTLYVPTGGRLILAIDSTALWKFTVEE